VFQAFHLIEEKSAVANVMLPLMIAGMHPSEAEQKALEHLESVGLADISRERVETFSAGQKQRTALARGLVNDPEILIADEPTGNLDRENGAAVFSLLMENAEKEGRTVLIATHDTAVLPDTVGNMISLEHGKRADDEKTA
jgi:ABC-type lipoprotein export system ATPase subunit